METLAEQYAQGAIISRLVLSLIATTATLLSQDEWLSTSCADALLMCAIFIGQEQAKPMGASKISAYIGMPRATVIRRLTELSLKGIIQKDAKRRWCLKLDTPETLARGQAVRAANMQHINRAIRDLSKLDTSKVAQR